MVSGLTVLSWLNVDPGTNLPVIEFVPIEKLRAGLKQRGPKATHVNGLACTVLRFYRDARAT